MTTTSSNPIITDAKRPRPIRSALERPWSVQDSEELYQILKWGQGFFGINDAGHVVVRPTRSPQREVDMYEIVTGLRERGYKTPVLLSFSDLLNRRINDLHDAFANAIAENNYKGRYCAVYPIKVNQQRHLVEQVHNYGEKFSFGLEAGSKPELLAVLGMTVDQPDRPIICNGFKEERYMEFIVLAAKLGRTIVPVIENLSELQLLLDASERYGVRPRIGVRVNLDIQGAGRWRHSSGAKAKFGLSISEVLEVFEVLKQRDMQDCLQLLHCHAGSQMHDIRTVMAAVNELTRIYVELAKMGAGLKWLDIGGGLSVDYDGSQTNFEFSCNYTLQEYATNVVYRVMSICDDAEVPHPTIVTECGRAMVAHHSVLVFDTLGTNTLDRFAVNKDMSDVKTIANGDDTPRPILDLLEAYNGVTERRMLECYHDALQARDEAMQLFSLGHLRLEHRAMVERLFWSTCVKIMDKARDMDHRPEELDELEAMLSDTYFCNLSIFQSLPDVWAIDQIFPIMPIHHLDERPNRRATLADITCDSDGKVDRFVDQRDIKRTLELHPVAEGEEYYIGAFLVGAYQETLGDLHNLFGDTHVVHIRLDDNGQWWIDQVVEGDTMREVLKYVQYDVDRLYQDIRRECELAVRNKQLTVSESRALVSLYETGLAGYTYLE